MRTGKYRITRVAFTMTERLKRDGVRCAAVRQIESMANAKELAARVAAN